MPPSYVQAELNGGDIRIIQPGTRTYKFNLLLVNKKTPREATKMELLRNVFAAAFNLKNSSCQYQLMGEFHHFTAKRVNVILR